MSDILNKKISVVVPCYNEEGNVEELYRRLTLVLGSLVNDHEIIFIDNKSSDSTPKKLADLAKQDRRVVVIFFSRNFGHSQYGFTAGTEYSTGDAVVWIDADLQDPPELIPEFVEKWQKGYEVVYGIRVKRKGKLWLRVAYKMFYAVFSKLSNISVPRDAGDFSLLDRRVVDVLNSMSERDRFMRGLRAWAGFRSTGIEYHRDERRTGFSSNDIYKNIWWAKKAIFSFSYTPVEMVFYLALIALVIAVSSVFFYMGAYLFGSGPPRGFTSLLLVVLFFGSAQLLAISIIAEYVSRIFEEVKQRPKYVIDKILNDYKKPGHSR